MKKFRILFIFTLAVLLTFTAATVETKADTATKLVVHYHRFDPNYGGWKLWLWPYAPTPGSGADYSFNGTDDFGVYYETDLTGSPFEGSTEIGVIVKDGSWNKDVALDRFIDLTDPNVDGEVHAYLVSGDPTIYYSDAGIDISNRALSVNFDTINSVEFTASKNVTASDIQLFADGSPVTIENFVMLGGEASFDLTNDADLGKQYTLIIDFNDAGVDPKEYTVGFAGLYASDAFNDQYAYDGELGAIYSTASTTFKLWAPLSSDVTLNLYDVGHRSSETDYEGTSGTDTPYETYVMTKMDKGVWEVTVTGDLHGVYYTFDVTNGSVTNEASDPYAFSSGVNGRRSMVVDFDRLDPSDWQEGYRPNTIESYNDSVITEIHVRDYTTHSSWNGTEELRGKFLGLVESGTTYNGVTTGFDHIKELGVTHVQLLPSFDFGAAVDETRILDQDYSGVKDTVFNWGYMPENFNTVEGSYSTNPYDGSVRVSEFKQMVQAFHDEDIRVVMDVVYNHHGKSADSNFDLIVPGYYFRLNDNGGFSNGSGTGNETASEHYMMSKFMVDSVTFWAEEYNISGFRFDLMKLHDVATMNAIVDSVHAIDPTILIYGEPWDAGGSALDEDIAAYNSNLDQMPGVAVFNDDTRDGIKGSVFNEADAGFVQGNSSSDLDERVKLGIVGAVPHYSISVPSLPKGAWAINPNQTVNYTTAHDNNVLYDKLLLSTEGVTYEELQDMQKQANAIILTSAGIPFLHGGVEIMRSKPCTVIEGEAQGECDASLSYDHNSYRSPDQTNQIDWQWKVDNIEVFNYYKGLIEIRKNIGVFSYDSETELEQHLFFLPSDTGMVSYMIYDENSPWQYTLVSYNNSVTARPLDLQGNTWNLIVNKDLAGLDTIEVVSGTYNMQPNETVVMYVANPNVVFLPDIVDPILDPLADSEYDKNNMFDGDALAQQIEDLLPNGYSVEVTHTINYDLPGQYNVTVAITDANDNVTNEYLLITVLDTPSSAPIGMMIGGIIGGVVLVGGAIAFFIIRKRTQVI
jgi:pullulanase